MSNGGTSPGSPPAIYVVVEIHAVQPLLESAFDIAIATGRTVYDSIYLALAISLGRKFVTADEKLCNALRAGPFAEDVLWVTDPS